MLDSYPGLWIWIQLAASRTARLCTRPQSSVAGTFWQVWLSGFLVMGSVRVVGIEWRWAVVCMATMVVTFMVTFMAGTLAVATSVKLAAGVSLEAFLWMCESFS